MNRQEKKNVPVSVRKPVKRKPKDKPKRPLSAYNFFFKEQRAKIVAIIEDGAFNNDLTDEEVIKLRKENGKVSFEEMGKIIGRRWKEISQGQDPERKKKYGEMADNSTERYKADMQRYNERQDELRENNKRRSTAMHYTQMAPSTYAYPTTHPPMMRYSENHVSYDAPHMGYVAYHPMNQNASYGYLPQMMTAYNHHEGYSQHESDGTSYHYPAQRNYAAPHDSRYPQPNYYQYPLNGMSGGNDHFYASQHPKSQNIEPDATASSGYTSQRQSHDTKSYDNVC